MNDSLMKTTGHGFNTRRQQTYLHFRVEGIARELKSDLIIALKNTNKIVELHKSTEAIKYKAC